MALTFRVLGPVDIERDGITVPLGSRKRRLLIAILLCNFPRPVPAGTLVDVLWECPPPSADANLRLLVHQLRADLGPGSIVHDRRSGYALAIDADRIDAAEFATLAAAGRAAFEAGDMRTASRRLHRALSLWRGEPFADLPGATALSVDVARLTEQRADALERRVDADLALGLHRELIAELTLLTSTYPFRERFHGQLMRALYRSGRQVEALEVYRRVRTTLADELGLEPGGDLSALRDAMLRTDPTLHHERSTAGSPPETARSRPDGRPNLLPPGLSDFIGRTSELDTIAAALVLDQPSHAPTVITISGMGGVGKTALAIRAARTALDRYPDGCLHVDLRGASAAPADPHVVLGTLLRALRVEPDRVPSEPDDRLGLYRSTTAGLRLLIVLDNVRNEAQVRPLIPGSEGSAVIITSRRQLAAIEGASALALRPISDEDGRRLLSRVAGIDYTPGEAADAIVRLCGGLPLALRIAGARLARHDDIDLRRLHMILADERSRLDHLSVGDHDVRGTLSWSVRQLQPISATLFGLLGTLGVPETSPWVAACLLDTAPPRAEQVLRELTDVSLLTVVTTALGPRYRLHDLVQIYAKEQAGPAASVAPAIRRLYEAVAGATVTCDGLLNVAAYPTQPSDPAWYRPAVPLDVTSDWLETELDMVYAAVGDAADRGWQPLAVRILTGTTNFVGLGHRPDEWHRLAERLAAADDPALLLACGGMLRLRGDNDHALSMQRRARLMFRRRSDPSRAAVAATEMGAILRRLGRPRVAEASFRWAISRFAEVDSPPQEISAHIGLGNVFLKAMRFADAQNAYRDALALAERHGPAAAPLYPNVLGCLAAVHAALGQHDEALAHYGEALILAEAMGDRSQQAQLRWQVALVHRDAGDRPAVADAAERALEVFTLLGYTNSAGRARELLATVGGPGSSAVRRAG